MYFLYGYGILSVIIWVVAVVLALTWLFLPWIIIAKMDQMIAELHSLAQLLTKSGLK